MKKYKISIIILTVILGASLYLNFWLYEKNKQFSAEKGSQYIVTVRNTLFHIKPGDADRWIVK
ncbi:hypothetical protein [Bacillus niameyensis]|uniref:hypothetical protein n=1 Tax=Bacillus niameyensis TaxID=1522308 RepID=UPI00078397E2|nr:hypothetical protein [Bacillus niameyensis]